MTDISGYWDHRGPICKLCGHLDCTYYHTKEQCKKWQKEKSRKESV